MTATDPPTAMTLGRWKRVSPAEEGLQPGASLVWGVKGRSRSTTHSSPCPLSRGHAQPCPCSPQLGKSSEAPAPGPRAARTSGPFCTAAPGSWTAARGDADNPGACGQGRGGLSCQGDPGAGKAAPARRGPDSQAGSGGGTTMSCRKRSFTFGAYGG